MAFGRDETDDENAANEAAVREMEARMGTPETETSEEESEFEVGADLPSEADARKTRMEKKQERGELWENNNRLQEENRQLAERLARLEGVASSYPEPQRLMEMLHQQRQGGQPQRHPADVELDRVNRDISAIVGEYRQNPTPERLQQLEARARELEDRKHQLYYYKYGQQRQQQQDPRQSRMEAMQAAVAAMYQAEFPDVMGNENASAWARGRWQQRLAEGATNTMELAREVLEEARTHFTPSRGGSRRQPGEDLKSRYGGVSRSGSERSSRTFRMDDAQKAMAVALYPDLPEREAYQKWVNTVGNDLQSGGRDRR